MEDTLGVCAGITGGSFSDIACTPSAIVKFLRSIKEEYVQYAELLHEGNFTNKAELSAADKWELEALKVPKGAAGLIIKAAQGTGV